MNKALPSAYRGDSFNLYLTIEDADGVAIDISGWSFFLTLKKCRGSETDDSNAAASSTTTSHLDAVNGKSLVSLTPSQTNNLLGLYQFDVQQKTDTGDIRTILSGSVTFLADVTRRTS